MKTCGWLHSQGALKMALCILGTIALQHCAVLDAVVPARTQGTELSPEKTVESYLSAFQTGDFAAAYQYVSRGMAQSKDREAWAEEQQSIMQFSGVEIMDFQVFPSKVEGDKAYVPNILESKDDFINKLGVVEHELYTLIREENRWKIDQQQVVESGDKTKWFPAEGDGK